MELDALLKIKGIKKEVQYIFGNTNFLTEEKINEQVEKLYFENKLGLIDDKSKELQELTDILAGVKNVKNDVKKKLDFLILKIFEQYLDKKLYVIQKVKVVPFDKKNSFKVEF